MGDKMQNTKIDEFNKILFCSDGQQQVDWNALSHLLPDIDPNSCELTQNLETMPTLLFVLAERVDCSPECKNFVTQLLNDPRTDFTVKDTFFDNSILLWAISRYHEKTEDAILDSGNPYESNTSNTLYAPIHTHSIFVDLLCQKIIDTPSLRWLLTDYGSTFAINTPLLMALKNYDLKLAEFLLPFYDKKSLMIKTRAGNSVLHLAAFLRLNGLIAAIIKQAQSLGDDALEALVQQKNASEKTPAACYLVEPPEVLLVNDLLSSAEAVKICGLRLDTKTISDWHPGTRANLVMAQAFARLGSAQEGAHRFTQFARGSIDPVLADLFSSTPHDLKYGDLSDIFIPKPQRVPAKPSRMLTFFFSPQCLIKDPQKQLKVVDDLCEALPDCQGEVFITQFYEGPIGARDLQTEYPIVNIHRQNPRGGSYDGAMYYFSTSRQLVKMREAQSLGSNDVRTCQAGATYKKSL